jgi:hypothetical protein
MDDIPQVFEGALYTVFPTMRTRGTEVTQFIHGGQVPTAAEHEAPSFDEVCMFSSRISSASGSMNSTAVRQRIAAGAGAVKSVLGATQQRLEEGLSSDADNPSMASLSNLLRIE